MPENSPAVKKNYVEQQGANIYMSDTTLQAREKLLNDVIAKTGAEFIPPYNDYRIIRG